MTEAPRCAQCGATGRVGSAFCAACGAALSTLKAAPGSPATTVGKPKNSVLGWFVVAALVVGGFTLNLTSFEMNPLVPSVCIVLIIGLIVKRLRTGSFGKGWFTASVIIGFLLFFGAIGQAANNPGVDTGGGVSMWLPAVLALIARIRVRSED